LENTDNQKDDVQDNVRIKWITTLSEQYQNSKET